MSKYLLLILVLIFSPPQALAIEGEAKALERLAMTTEMLICIGEEMVDDAISGTLISGDTLSLELSLEAAYSYQFIIWTDSAFNYVDFWLTNPFGETPRGDFSDHTTLSIMPDSTETGLWSLHMELIEGAYSDTAYYAAAIFKRSRVPQ